MSAIPPAVADVLLAQQSATQQQIGMKVLAKQLQASRQAGDAINQMIQSTAAVQKQIAAGHLDVRV